ncbi:Protein PCP-2, partial [Aphelenchoides avenae]
GTNVVFTNGAQDPWHKLGIYRPHASHDPSVVALLIDGSAHCWDMYNANSADVIAALKTITVNVEQWVRRGR